MKVQRLRCIVLILIGLLFSIGYIVDVQAAGKPAYSLYIGKVADKPDEFVGIAVFGEDTTIYICDGQPDKGTVRIAEWFIGKVADKKIDITGKTGNQVLAALSRRSAQGQFKFKDGTVKKFDLTRGESTTALYRAEFAFGDKHYVGGWLVLADGSVRGAVLTSEIKSWFPRRSAPITRYSARKNRARRPEWVDHLGRQKPFRESLADGRDAVFETASRTFISDACPLARPAIACPGREFAGTVATTMSEIPTRMAATRADKEMQPQGPYCVEEFD